MHPSLTLRAGPEALRLLHERGLRAEDVDVLPGASGGPKWLVLAGLDRVLFGEFLRTPRSRPLHLIGASIGSWRLACLAQKEPLAALERFAAAYLDQRYPPKPPPSLVSETSARILDALLGPDGAEDIVSHPWARLHIMTTLCRGPTAREQKGLLLAGLAVAALANALSRRTLALQMKRAVFHTAGDSSPFAGLRDLPTIHHPLTRENLRAALLASGSIPGVMSGVHIPGAPRGTYRDGGVLDYHPNLHFGPGEGLVLYPHFYPHVIPGWFDKSLRWRWKASVHLQRALLLSPSEAFIARLPHGKIPDRDDFVRFSDAERIRAWNAVREASQQLGDELRELLATGRIAERVQPL
ncbi:patatin-like phospholipase family protein [Stigmatella sp. ncwal1]|uniref:Patatin-like phospholipase family protein n=1 Tax=Stigmatella ashevillensis TaxID=2995309 RepID=A0ABT5DIB9_9BACT|nr:patatin-like phospholipase family protein [Stigmatella ashevillena]MDC0712518.1 patatin-like phospholipase family protein [Stigmatella ashevillena]